MLFFDFRTRNFLPFCAYASIKFVCLAFFFPLKVTSALLRLALEFVPLYLTFHTHAFFVCLFILVSFNLRLFSLLTIRPGKSMGRFKSRHVLHQSRHDHRLRLVCGHDWPVQTRFDRVQTRLARVFTPSVVSPPAQLLLWWPSRVSTWFKSSLKVFPPLVSPWAQRSLSASAGAALSAKPATITSTDLARDHSLSGL